MRIRVRRPRDNDIRVLDDHTLRDQLRSDGVSVEKRELARWLAASKMRMQTYRIRRPDMVVSSPGMTSMTTLPTRSIWMSTVCGDQVYGVFA